MERYNKCKLCFQIFINGKALRSHMRSHTATASSLSYSTYSSSSLTSEESSEAKDKILGHGLRKNPKKSSRWLDPEFSDDAENRAWETESTRTRSEAEVRVGKMVKRTKPTSNESIPKLDSFSSDREIALCLMMLSRDSTGSKQSPTRKRVYKCPFCDRIFGSGQAFGGHKKVHFLPLSVRRGIRSGDSSCGGKEECLAPKKIDDFDLNLPATSMEDEGVDISTIDSQ